MFAGLAVFIFALAAFAIDVARVLVVRNELQNAADAAALAGAGWLMPAGVKSPDWVTGANKATQAITYNGTEGSRLQTGTVRVGYWDLVNKAPSGGAWNTGITPGANDVPAVEVTVSRDTGENSGPVELLFGRLLGVNLMPAKATATAAISAAVSFGPGSLLPFAVSDCVTKTSTKLMKGWPDSPEPEINPDTGEPWKFVIATAAASGTKCGPCQCGQWTSFGSGASDADYIRDLLTEGSDVTLGVGSNTYIQPGVEATLYGTVGSLLVGQTVAIPIVSEKVDLSVKGYQSIVGFACLVIDAGIQGGDKKKVCSTFQGQKLFADGVESNQCVIGHFAKPQVCTLPNSGGGGGGNLTTHIPPRLVQ